MSEPSNYRLEAALWAAGLSPEQSKGTAPVRAKPKTWKLPPGEELWEADPNCDHDITSGIGGGIRCVKCRGWFCY